MDPAEVVPLIILLAVFVALVIAGVAAVFAVAAAWTAIWLTLKLVATVVALPPALVLSECCNCQGPKGAVFKVLRLRWDCLLPEDKDKDKNKAASAERAQASPSNVGPATANTASLAERDVERGIPERDPAGCPLPPPDMDIADGIIGEPAPPSYSSAVDDHPDEPLPEYEEIESGHHAWG